MYTDPMWGLEPCSECVLACILQAVGVWGRGFRGLGQNGADNPVLLHRGSGQAQHRRKLARQSPRRHHHQPQRARPHQERVGRWVIRLAWTEAFQEAHKNLMLCSKMDLSSTLD